MMKTIKRYAAAIYGLIVVILGGLLFNRNRKVRSLESALITEKTDNVIKGNEHDRKIAADIAADLLEEYEKSKRS